MKNERKKLIRITTADISLDSLLKGQLRFLNQYFDVVGVAKDTGVLQKVGEREGIRVIDAPLERPITPVKDIKALWFLFRLFRQEKPWCVHANTPKGSLLAMIAAWMARVPHRIYLVTGLRYQGTTGVFRFILKTMERMTCLFASKVIPEGNGVLCSLQSDHITSKPLEVIHYGNINGKDTSFLSRENTIETSSFVVDNGQIRLQGKSVEDAREFVREKLGCTAEDFLFISIGRITNDKGMGELADAMKRLEATKQNVKLLLIGELEGEDDLVDTDKLEYFRQSKAVIYVGVQLDIRPFLLASDVLVFPSYREGFPNVPLEAGAMNLPCIVTNISGSNEIIKDGLNGKIIQAPLDDKGKRKHDITDALYNTMLWFVCHRAEAKRMGENARPMICERYEQKDVWLSLLNMYNALDSQNKNV
uniref:Glycosyltransferase family 4 protein n=1 Tax=Prevotella sp. GTC17259 TaxID=3236795 RepID=A0AB33J0Q2_9BACT